MLGLFFCLPVSGQSINKELLLQKESDVDLTWSTERFKSTSPTTRIDAATDELRAAYSLNGLSVEGSTAIERARSVVRKMSSALAISDEKQLTISSVAVSPTGEHVTFQQVFDGVPVIRRQVKVNIDNDRTPTLLFSSFEKEVYNRSYRWPVGQVRAEEILHDSIDLESILQPPGRAVFIAESPMAVYRAIVTRRDRPGEWEIVLDASSGELLQVLSLSAHVFREEKDSDVPSGRTVQQTFGQQGGNEIDGVAMVFDPDPLSVSGNTYGAPFVDDDDANIPQLNAQRRTAALRDITQGADNFYRLEGPFVAITGNSKYDPPEQLRAQDFVYTRGEIDFEAANAYYHIDKSQRYLQSLGFSTVQVKANPRASSRDNSFYNPNQHLIEFGTGGIDDAEDGGVIWHEFGHAILETATSGLLATVEGQALHEGWSDYWAASYLRELAETDVTARQDWRAVFKWDSGDGEVWSGRTVDKVGIYPDDTTCDDPGDTNSDGCNIYSDGLYWASALMNLQDDIGKEVADRVVLQSLYYLNAPATFRDAAEAVLQADRDLYNGDHLTEIFDNLQAYGFLEPSGPTLVHTPLKSSEVGDIAVDVWVEAFSESSAAVETVVLYFGIDEEPNRTLRFEPANGDSFHVELELPTVGVVNYYIQAWDSEGARSVFPATAPEVPLSIEIGPDRRAPTIAHEPLAVSPLVRWPATVVAEVEDNIIVDSVWVEYLLRSETGADILSGRFDLVETGQEYRGDFPLTRDQILTGYSVSYRVIAQDASVGKNRSGLDEITLVAKTQGQLDHFSMEGPGVITTTGIWERGQPSDGLSVAHGGESLWGTNLTDSYPEVSTLSRLDMPSYDLRGVGGAYLEFWYWHDMEAPTGLTPEKRNDSPVPDGANVKMSTDGGFSWTVIEPLDGYNAVIDPRLVNPIAGEKAFGGYSFGWRKAVFNLPGAADVRTRVEFATDVGNDQPARGYYGFYIDDIRLVSTLPVDVVPPIIKSTPDRTTIARVVDFIDNLSILATDDTGIASVVVESESTDNLVPGLVRAEMDFDNLQKYDASLRPVRSPLIGDVIRYRFVVRDFAGNETVWPSRTEPPAVIEYRSVQADNLLGGVRGSGMWKEVGVNKWQVTGSAVVANSSSLNLEPYTVASNGTEIQFELSHVLSLSGLSFANVKISKDDGASWSVLHPDGGYGTIVDLSGSVMDGEPAWSNVSIDPGKTIFNLTPLAGESVRIRLDFVSTDVSGSDHWLVNEFAAQTSTSEPVVEFEWDLELYKNFPEPASSYTTISYTLPEIADATLSLYDISGRRVKILVSEMQAPGAHTVEINTTDLAAGLYLIFLESGGETRTEKMVVTG